MTAETTQPPMSASGAGGGVLHGVLRALPALTLVAVLTITASAEYELARTVLGLRPQIAWALPAAIDSYVLAALHTRRDVPAAITVMAGALTAAMGAHLAQVGRGGHPLPPTWTAPLATAIMTVLVIVAWRVHVLIASPSDRSAADSDVGTDAAGPRLAVSAPAWRAPVSVPQAPSRFAVEAPGVPADAARVALAPDPVLSSPRSRTSTPSDEQILAAIGDESPSIRALMREHGIGQGRATRLHRTILDHRTEATTGTTTTRSRTEQAQQEHDQRDHDQRDHDQEDHQEQPASTTGTTANSQNEDTEEAQSQNAEASHEEEPNRIETRIESKGTSDTHTCITDRVGNSRSTRKEIDHDGASERPHRSTDSAGFCDIPLDLSAAVTGAAGGR